MLDLSKYSDQEIIDSLKNRKSVPMMKQANSMISQTIEDGFARNKIDLRCPICGSVNHVKNGTNSNGTKRFKCLKCGKSYTASTNTIFEGTSYSWEEMVNFVYMVISKDTVSRIAFNTGNTKLSQGATWMTMHKIMHILSQMNESIILKDVIEIDEKYFRETQKGSRNLVSFIDNTHHRYPRTHNKASKCGIFGPEFINCLCAVDNSGHYWAKCICLGTMQLEQLQVIDNYIDSKNVNYICTDKYSAYKEWIEGKPYIHYVEPSTYRIERKARGYIDTDDTYNHLTEQEYKLDKDINIQMYKEGRYPHLENTKKMSYDEFVTIRYKFNLGINRVNGFHGMLDNYLVSDTKGVNSNYLQDYIGTFVYLQNYKTDHNIVTFTKAEAEQILKEMIKFTLSVKHSPTDSEILDMKINLPRPNKKETKKAEDEMREARKLITMVKKDSHDKSEYEGDDEISQYLFNKTKFFNNLGTVRLNEIIKEQGLYQKGAHKQQKVQALCSLPTAQDIIFREIYLHNYGSTKEFQDAINNCTQPIQPKRKRGRPKGSKNKTV